jgi:hypothetical protein
MIGEMIIGKYFKGHGRGLLHIYLHIKNEGDHKNPVRVVDILT